MVTPFGEAVSAPCLDVTEWSVIITSWPEGCNKETPPTQRSKALDKHFSVKWAELQSFLLRGLTLRKNAGLGNSGVLRGLEDDCKAFKTAVERKELARVTRIPIAEGEHNGSATSGTG